MNTTERSIEKASFESYRLVTEADRLRAWDLNQRLYTLRSRFRVLDMALDNLNDMANSGAEIYSTTDIAPVMEMVSDLGEELQRLHELACGQTELATIKF